MNLDKFNDQAAFCDWLRKTPEEKFRWTEPTLCITARWARMCGASNPSVGADYLRVNGADMILVLSGWLADLNKHLSRQKKSVFTFAEVLDYLQPDVKAVETQPEPKINKSPLGAPRPHYDLIIAYANGAEIEWKNMSGDWVPSKYPAFYPADEYRIKERPKASKWRWVSKKDNGDYEVTYFHYTEYEAANYKFEVKIPSSEIKG